eukprot:3788855-Pleurochrysis_carterae.AAC.6
MASRKLAEAQSLLKSEGGAPDAAQREAARGQRTAESTAEGTAESTGGWSAGFNEADGDGDAKCARTRARSVPFDLTLIVSYALAAS